jgi:molybdate transport system regulatory protein
MATRFKAAHIKADGRFWLTLDGKNFLGRGRVELLQRIRETGSISKAAKAMKMSYKAAWDAVDAMNAAWGSILVESGPAGSRLTADAEHLIARFKRPKPGTRRSWPSLRTCPRVHPERFKPVEGPVEGQRRAFW